MADLYQRTIDKRKYLEENGYKYICMWECEFDRQCKESRQLQNYIESLEIVPPLEPRDAFYEGRTEVFTLYKEAGIDETIKYYDVASLYPFINKRGNIQLGHPTIITENIKDIDHYEGLIKCKITPPRNLQISVLPTKINGKFMFTLCRTCTENNSNDKCHHTEKERSLTVTWVTDEVKKAIAKGYKVRRIYEGWHFNDISQYDPETRRGCVFTEYVNTFLKLKQEASGWPEWCQSKEDRQKYN